MEFQQGTIDEKPSSLKTKTSEFSTSIGELPNNGSVAKLEEGCSISPKSILSSKFDKWTAQDDLALTEAAQKGLSIMEIVSHVKFSKKFNVQEVMQRWKALLYDKDVAKEAAKRMLALRSTSGKRIPWTTDEDAIIMEELKMHQKDPTYILNAKEILNSNPGKFHPLRTPKSLESHMYKLKYKSFGDVSASGSKSRSKYETFDEDIDIAENLEEETYKKGFYVEKLKVTKEDVIESKKLAKQASRLERELVLTEIPQKILEAKQAASMSTTDSTSEIPLQQPQAESFLDLFNDHYIFHVTKEVTTIGRKHADDVTSDRGVSSSSLNSGSHLDLTLTGYEDLGKVSRLQAMIFIRFLKVNGVPDAQVSIKNVGKRSIHLNGEEVLPEAENTLRHGHGIVFPGGLTLMVSMHQKVLDHWAKIKA